MNKFRFDTHAHLDLYKNSTEIINYIEENRSYTIAVTNLPVLYQKYINEYQNLKYVRFALGIHPELVFQYKEQISSMIDYIKEAKYIGEVGLDYVTRDIENRDVQREAFKKIVEECDKIGGKVLSIHSRRAEKEVLLILGDSFNGKVILHWFSGNLKELKTASRLGFYFSINTDMIVSKKGIELIKNMPLDRILVESDAPFTKDTKKEYSLDLFSQIEKAVAQIKGIDLELMNQIFENNFKQLLVKI